MSRSFARASRIASSCPKDLDIQYFIFQEEREYSMWMSYRRIADDIFMLPDQVFWNSIMCVLALVCTICVSMDFESTELVFTIPVSYFIDIIYNALYFVDLLAHILNDLYKVQHEEDDFNWSKLVWYLADFLSYGHYQSLVLKVPKDVQYIITLVCYYVRLHRPLAFLWALLHYYLIGNVLLSLLKYIYICLLMRVLFTNFYIWLDEISDPKYKNPPYWLQTRLGSLSYRGFYVITKLFIGIGPDTPADYDFIRLLCVAVMILGRLLLNGVATASMSLILCLYMRPEETFRSRFRLIMKDMHETKVPRLLCQKVETFYRMYWHKQKAVSVTKLLPICPPTIASTIFTEIYFEAHQKSRILRDLSYQFLSEISKHMQTINYIPGDTIVKRNESKSAIIYISYGDVEMLTAEDDETPILRFSRGSIINGCGGCVQVACAPAHVIIRAATFCTAHVLQAADLWRVTVKYGKTNGQTYMMRAAFQEHIDRVKKHYQTSDHSNIKYKSNVVLLKRNLLELKEARDQNGKLLISRSNAFLEIAGCYIMRNDATLTQESDPICLRPTFPCILQPTSSLQVAWQAFVSLLTIIVAFVYPYQLVYKGTDVSAEFIFFDYMVTLVFILDIITHLSTGDKIEEGVPIRFTQTSTNQIMSMWFVADVISVAPIFEFIGDGHFAGINRLVKLVKVFRVLKHMEDAWVYQANTLRFGAYCLLVFLECYLMATLNQAYLCFHMKYCELKNLTQEPYWEKMPAQEENVGLRMLYGLYWAITIMTSTSHKTSQFSKSLWHVHIFILIVLEICLILHIMVEALYSATIMVTETMSDDYNMWIDRVKKFLIKNNVDPILRNRFITYLRLRWFTDKAYSITHAKSSILFDLPSHVYQDISATQLNKYILCIPFMKSLHKEVLKDISSNARLFYTSPNEILLNTGDVTNEIYVIKQGFCEVVDPNSREVVMLISSKSYFGDLECLLRLPAYYTVRAVTHVQVFTISIRVLEAVAPKIVDAIIYTKLQPEYNMLLKRREQFLKYVVPPKPPNRMMFPLPRKHEPDVAFLYPFNRLGFLSILRYVFPRFTIRPDGLYLKRYEWFRVVCACTSASIFPIYSTLVLQWPEFWYFAWLLDITAYCDIIQRMLVGYFDEKGILVYHPASTAAHYIRSAFLLDLFACLPLEALDSVRLDIIQRGDTYKYPSTLQLLRFNRLLQMYRVPNALEILDDYIQRKDIILIIKSIPLFVALLIVVTSLMVENSVNKWVKLSGGWILEPKNYEKFGSWITINSEEVRYNITETPFTLLLTTFYWVTYEITNTGFDIFQPSNEKHLCFLLCGMMLGSMTITYFTVRVISIRSNVNRALASFQQHMMDMVNFMKRESLPIELQNEVVSYYEYMWDKTGGTDYRTVLKMCDQITLRTDAILHIYGQTFAKCAILYHCDQSILRVMGRAVNSVYYRQNMIVIERDEVGSNMFFVDYGIVEVRDANDDDIILTRLPRGSIFGSLDKMKTSLSPNRFVSNTNVHLLKLNTVIFYKIVKDFPTIETLMEKYRPNGESYIIGSLRNPSVMMTIWKEHEVSTIEIVGQKGVSKYCHTQSKGMQIYLIIVSLLCVYGDIYNTGFVDNRRILVVVLYILDFMFMLKIILNFALPYITEEESEARVAASSRRQYYRGEFKYDILSCIPLEMLCFFLNDPWSLFGFCRLNRTLRVVTVYNCLQRYHERLSINLTFATIASVCIWFSMFAHTCASIWYYISYIEDYASPNSSWRYTRKGDNFCENHYICSLYFILTTFTQNGVGDILPRCKSEVAFVSVLMIMSTMIFVIYVGEFSNIIQYHSFRCFSFYSNYLELQEFLKNNRLAKNLVAITKRYTLHLWRESRGLQVPNFLTSAPQCLRLKIMSAAYMQHLLAHPLFKKCEPAFLRHLVGCFKPYYYNEDMYVVKQGEITNAMYFIHKGRVQEFDEDWEWNEHSNIIEVYRHFGTFQGLHRDTAFEYGYKTIIKSQVLTLNLEDWEYLLEHFPNNKKFIFPSHESKDFDNAEGILLQHKNEKASEKKHVRITKSQSHLDSLAILSQAKIMQENLLGVLTSPKTPPTVATEEAVDTAATAPSAATAPTTATASTAATSRTAVTAPTTATAPTAATSRTAATAPTAVIAKTAATAPTTVTAPTTATVPTATTARTAATAATAVATGVAGVAATAAIKTAAVTPTSEFSTKFMQTNNKDFTATAAVSFSDLDSGKDSDTALLPTISRLEYTDMEGGTPLLQMPPPEAKKDTSLFREPTGRDSNTAIVPIKRFKVDRKDEPEGASSRSIPQTGSAADTINTTITQHPSGRDSDTAVIPLKRLRVDRKDELEGASSSSISLSGAAADTINFSQYPIGRDSDTAVVRSMLRLNLVPPLKRKPQTVASTSQRDQDNVMPPTDVAPTLGISSPRGPKIKITKEEDRDNRPSTSAGPTLYIPSERDSDERQTINQKSQAEKSLPFMSKTAMLKPEIRSVSASKLDNLPKPTQYLVPPTTSRTDLDLVSQITLVPEPSSLQFPLEKSSTTSAFKLESTLKPKVTVKPEPVRLPTTVPVMSVLEPEEELTTAPSTASAVISLHMFPVDYNLDTRPSSPMPLKVPKMTKINRNSLALDILASETIPEPSIVEQTNLPLPEGRDEEAGEGTSQYASIKKLIKGTTKATQYEDSNVIDDKIQTASMRMSNHKSILLGTDRKMTDKGEATEVSFNLPSGRQASRSETKSLMSEASMSDEGMSLLLPPDERITQLGMDSGMSYKSEVIVPQLVESRRTSEDDLEDAVKLLSEYQDPDVTKEKVKMRSRSRVRYEDTSIIMKKDDNQGTKSKDNKK